MPKSLYVRGYPEPKSLTREPAIIESTMTARPYAAYAYEGTNESIHYHTSKNAEFGFFTDSKRIENEFRANTGFGADSNTEIFRYFRFHSL